MSRLTAGAMRVVVTGGAGFIGTHSVDALIGDGHTVLVLDDLRHASWRPLAGAADLVTLDVSTADARDVIADFHPDAILHLSAQAGVNRSWREPVEDARSNVLGLISVLQAAVDAQCPRIVFASSGGALYGDTDRLPTPEEQPQRPRSPYGCAKASGEVYLFSFARAWGLSPLALRYGNVYGPGQDGTGEAGVVAISSLRLVDGEAPVVRGDGEQTRDFVFVGDVADANFRAVKSDCTGAVNIGTGRESSVAQVVEHLCRVAGFQGRPLSEPVPTGEVRRSCLDVARAATLLDWRAVTDLATGLGSTFASFSNDSEAPSHRGLTRRQANDRSARLQSAPGAK